MNTETKTTDNTQNHNRKEQARMEVAKPEEAGLVQAEELEMTKIQEAKPEALAKLEEMEATIRQGMETFILVGEQLLTIQRKKLYRLKGYKSFDGYCEKELGLSRSYCYQRIAHINMCEALDVSPEEVPEKTLRPLARFKDNRVRRQLWEKAIKTCGGKRPTYKIVRDIVQEHSEKQKSRDVESAEQDPAQACDVSTEESLSQPDIVTTDVTPTEQEEDIVDEMFKRTLVVKPETTTQKAILFEQAKNLFNECTENKDKLSASQKERIRKEFLNRMGQLYDEMTK